MKLIKGAAELGAVEAGEACGLRDGDEAGMGNGVEAQLERLRHGSDEGHGGFMREIGLWNVDMKACPMELVGSVADHSVEGIASGTDGEELVGGVGVVGFDGSVGRWWDVSVKVVKARGVLVWDAEQCGRVYFLVVPKVGVTLSAKGELCRVNGF